MQALRVLSIPAVELLTFGCLKLLGVLGIHSDLDFSVAISAGVFPFLWTGR